MKIIGVAILLSKDEQESFGFSSWASTYKNQIIYTTETVQTYYYKRKNEFIWLPEYMIKEIITIEKGRELYPELFL